MKKAFIILTLLIAFNFTVPVGQTFSQNARHGIEFVREDKSRGLSNNEVLKKKVTLYIRYHILLARVTAINSDLAFNSS